MLFRRDIDLNLLLHPHAKPIRWTRFQSLANQLILYIALRSFEYLLVHFPLLMHIKLLVSRHKNWWLLANHSVFFHSYLSFLIYRKYEERYNFFGAIWAMFSPKLLINFFCPSERRFLAFLNGNSVRFSSFWYNCFNFLRS